MKKAFCLLLAVLLTAVFLPAAGLAAGEKPVIISPDDGGVLAAGGVTVRWTAVSGADRYTVNIRYIENGEDGPLAGGRRPRERHVLSAVRRNDGGARERPGTASASRRFTAPRRAIRTR